HGLPERVGLDCSGLSASPDGIPRRGRTIRCTFPSPRPHRSSTPVRPAHGSAANPSCHHSQRGSRERSGSPASGPYRSRFHMSFESLGLAPTLLRALAEQGYTQPTPVQSAAIPVV